MMMMYQQRYRAQTLKVRAHFVCRLFCLLLTAASAPTPAFVVVPTDEPNEYLKWGPSHIAGTTGGVITWGFLAAGTPGSSTCGSYCIGNSVDMLPNFYATPERDNRTTPTTLLSLQAAFQAAFDAWSSVADVQFQYVGVDHSMKPINDPTTRSPQIRIGVYSFGGLWAYCLAGTAFAAPPNVGTVAGDIFLNANVGFQLSSSPEDSELQPFPVGNGLHMTDVYMLALHEIGHAIGLGDSAVADSVRCSPDPSSASLRREYLWRKPRADDIAGAQFLYGRPKGPTTSGPAAETR